MKCPKGTARRISDLEDELPRIKKRLEMLECEHSSFSFKFRGGYIPYYMRVCDDCGKRMEWLSEIEMLTRSNVQLSEKIEKNKERLKNISDQGDKSNIGGE